MTKFLITQLKYQIGHFLQSQRFFHALFWILFYTFLLLVDRSALPLWFKLLKGLAEVVFYGAIVYINILYLIPRLLETKKTLPYIISVLLLVILITPIKTLTLIFLYAKHPEIQQMIIDNQLGLYFICLFVATASTVYKMTNVWLVQKNETRELKSQQLQSELKFLKAQINPHFFFNTLNNLYALTLKKSDLAPEIVLRLSEMMRYMLYESNEKRVPLEKEITYVRNYLELEKLRQGKNFDLEFNLSGEVDHQQIAPLIFIPFLENSFKHGLDNQIKSGFVHIDMHVTKTEVQLAIKNSKPPNIIDYKARKAGGIGLKNVKRRLEIIYPKKHELHIEDKPNTFKILLNLQL